MLYTPLTRKALNIAAKAHEGQTDRAGVPYIVHPVIVADNVEGGELETCAALLHDVVEDTDWTIEALAQEGFPVEVTDALKLLTHQSGMPYMEYVAAVKENPVARAVKLSDLAHNMDLGRLPEVTDKDRARVEKYSKAREFLLS